MQTNAEALRESYADAREQELLRTNTAARAQEQRLNEEMRELEKGLAEELQAQKDLTDGIRRSREEQEAAAALHSAALQQQRLAAAVARNESKQGEVSAVEGYPGWFKTLKGDEVLYFNPTTQEQSTTHPVDLATGYHDELDMDEVAEAHPTKIDWSTSDSHRGLFFLTAASMEFVMLILYIIFADYDDPAKTIADEKTDFRKAYPFFQDVHVMVFIGFGFLMTFLNRYGYSALGYNFLLSAFTIQWCILISGLIKGAFDDFPANCPRLGYSLVRHQNMQLNDTTRFCIKLNMDSLVQGDFGAAAVLITYGAVLGKTNPMQMLVVALLEMVVYEINIQIGVGQMEAVDMGGSIFIHTFGAYFGLALSWVLTSSRLGDKGPSGKLATQARAKMKASTPTSDLFSMFGTLFLWMFWPSFNGVLASGDQQYRVIVNTVLALSACCVTAFAVDNLVRPEHKFNMVSIQNATLAGGVAVGASADLVILPWGAILVGMLAGALSVAGYRYIQPALEQGGLDDTCGVHNLHGMPGVMAGLAGAMAAAAANTDHYGASMGTVFPARADNSGRTAGEQARNQIAALFVTLILSILGGVLTGVIVKCKCCLYSGQVKGGDEAVRHGVCNLCHSSDHRIWYDDSYYWTLPDEQGTSSDSDSDESYEGDSQSSSVKSGGKRGDGDSSSEEESGDYEDDGRDYERGKTGNF